MHILRVALLRKRGKSDETYVEEIQANTSVVRRSFKDGPRSWAWLRGRLSYRLAELMLDKRQKHLNDK